MSRVYTAEQTALAKMIDRIDAEVVRLQKMDLPTQSSVYATEAQKRLNMARRWLTSAYDLLPRPIESGPPTAQEQNGLAPAQDKTRSARSGATD